MKIAALLLLALTACSPKHEKPKLTISEYTRQAVITKGVLDKILNEKEYQKMHEIALAVESSRAVDCISVAEECNVYGKILNKIVLSTTSGMPNEEQNREIYKLIGEFDEAVRVGHEKLANDWKEYIQKQGQDAH